MVTVGTAVSSRPPFAVGPTNMTLKGQQFASAFPNFYFHAATAHGIRVTTAWKWENGIFSG